MTGLPSFRHLWLLVAVAGLVPPAVVADEPLSGSTVSQQEMQAELPERLKELDHESYQVRRQAMSVLERWLNQPDLALPLAVEFRKALRDPTISFEVRSKLERWSRKLPAVADQPAAAISLPEVEQLVTQLDDDSYATRLAAEKRLVWLVTNPKMVCPTLVVLKNRMADPNLSPETRRRLEPTWREVRSAWLLGDGDESCLPPVSDAQLRAWIDELAQSPPDDAAGGWTVHVNARRELMDVLARDSYIPRVGQMIEARLAEKPDDKAVARLEEIQQLLRPALVAEFWQNHRHLGEQHLLVGVPSLAESAQRASYFDRIDDRVARCVSGQSLAAGEYPVGVAFPHPTEDNAFFHLVNLPTPRRQMAYACQTQLDQGRRLTEISRRTLDRLLAEKRPLSDRELDMLGQLDYAEVSRFVGRYFAQVEDDPVLLFTSDRMENPGSRHAAVCMLLSAKGTKEAVPGLLEAIQRQRFLEPTSTPPYRWPWLAALSIAARDPWSGVDAWLADLVNRRDRLIDYQADSPELGATAAGILAARHKRSALQCGLLPVAIYSEQNWPFTTYRFESDDDRQRVLQWWAEEGCHNKTALVEPPPRWANP